MKLSVPNKMDFRTILIALVLCTGFFINPAVCQDEGETTTEAPASTTTPPPATNLWTVGRITQVTLAIIESALLTLLLIYPSIMDPAVDFINRGIGAVVSRKRRETRNALLENAAAIHDLFLEAIDSFESLDSTLTSL